MKRLILISAALVLLDQATKILFANKHYGNEFLAISYTENTGTAFGLLQNTNFILTIISLIVITLILIHYRKLNYKFVWILLISGAVGNAIDRLLLGYVRDFISVYIWPSFNLADCYITLAILVLAYLILIDKKLFKVTN